MKFKESKKFSMENMSKEDFNKLKGLMLNACRDYEPWADMMMLGGAGDLGPQDFPLNLDDIESIEITVEGAHRSDTDSSGTK